MVEEIANYSVCVFPELSPYSKIGQEWEALVMDNEASGFMQSLHWARFKRRQGLAVVHLGLLEGENLAGGCIFYTAKNNRGAGFLVATEGPVLPWSEPKLAQLGMRLLVAEAEKLANSCGVMALRIEPRIAPPPPTSMRGFGRSPVDLIPQETLYVDLAVDETEILTRMKPKGRYNIGISERKGIVVTESADPASVERFYSIVLEASRRDHFLLEPLPFFQELAKTLCKTGVARFLFAEHDGDTLGAMLLITYGSRATYLYGGVSNLKRNLMAGYALQWQAMRIAKQAGCRTYDFYGFDQFQAPTNNYARFSRFKSTFGGNAARFIGAHDYYFMDNLVDAFVKVVAELQTPIDTKHRELSSRG